MKAHVFYVHPTVQSEVYQPLCDKFLQSVPQDALWLSTGFSILRPGADNGKDIGAFIEAAKTCKADIMVCLGAHVRVNSDGWLKRIVEVWDKHGAGLYGPFGSNEPVPHLRTTAFWCPPSLLANYPWPVVTDQDRYNFELSRSRSITRYAMDMNLPVMQVSAHAAYSNVFNPAFAPEIRLFNDRFADMQDAAR